MNPKSLGAVVDANASLPERLKATGILVNSYKSSLEERDLVENLITSKEIEDVIECLKQISLSVFILEDDLVRRMLMLEERVYGK